MPFIPSSLPAWPSRSLAPASTCGAARLMGTLLLQRCNVTPGLLSSRGAGCVPLWPTASLQRVIQRLAEPAGLQKMHCRPPPCADYHLYTPRLPAGGVFEEAIATASLLLQEGQEIAETVRTGSFVDNVWRVSSGWEATTGNPSGSVFPDQQVPDVLSSRVSCHSCGPAGCCSGSLRQLPAAGGQVEQRNLSQPARPSHRQASCVAAERLHCKRLRGAGRSPA